MIKINLFPEKWKIIPNYENYAVSNQGQVMRIAKGPGTYPGKTLKSAKTKYGYLVVGLFRDGKLYSLRVHRLVTLAFLGSCPLGKEVNHKDGKKLNNYLLNLEYLTKSENAKHAFKLGLKPNVFTVGSTANENHPQAKLNWHKVREIHKLRKFGLRYKEIAKIFNVSRSAIRDVLTKRRWIWVG